MTVSLRSPDAPPLRNVHLVRTDRRAISLREKQGRKIHVTLGQSGSICCLLRLLWMLCCLHPGPTLFLGIFDVLAALEY